MISPAFTIESPASAAARTNALLKAAKRVATDASRPNAARVDKEARFPHESLAALRQEKLLAAGIPVELGGLGGSMSDLVAICTVLGKACAATGMVFAMHQMQVGCIVRHLGDSIFFRDYLRDLAENQWLLASATSEVGVGGDLRSSITAIEATGEQFKLHKSCTTLSYGEHADAILITARREPNAASGDQVLALIRKENYTLKRTGDWDVMGMRGTCSPPFEVDANAAVEQILPEPFRNIATQTMLPYSHLLWSGVWLGIAADAVSTAQSLIKQMARKAPKTSPLGSSGLVDAINEFQQFRSNVRLAVEEYDRLVVDSEAIGVFSTSAYALRINNLKLASSQMVVQICLKCMAVCGLAGYANNSPFSLGRQLRDSLSAQLMINNNRLKNTNAGLLLITGSEILEDF